MHTRPLAVWTLISFYFLHIYCLFLLSWHPIYYKTCKLYARAELQPLCPGKHPNRLTRASCCFLHPGLSQAIWNACLHGVTAPSATMEGRTYINSRMVSELVAKALSTKVAGVYPFWGGSDYWCTMYGRYPSPPLTAKFWKRGHKRPSRRIWDLW